MRLCVFATRDPYREHVRPIWDALQFSEAAGFVHQAERLRHVDATVWLTAASRDYSQLRGRTPSVLMEHGCGLQDYPAAELARLSRADLVLAPNEWVASRYRKAGAKVEIVGTPKMDALSTIEAPRTETVAVSFHWSGARMMRGSTLMQFRDELAVLSSRFNLIGHAHPRIWGTARTFYESLGIPAVQSFSEVVKQADVYVCDHSSTIFEWCALGRPVVLLDRPGIRQQIRISGLRYSSHEAVGAHVGPGRLADAIDVALFGDPEHAEARRAATAALFPHLGTSTQRALDVLRSF